MIKVKVILLHAMEVLGVRGGIAPYSFLTSALDGGEWPRFTLGERTTGTHCTGGWVGPRPGLDAEATGKILKIIHDGWDQTPRPFE
jgi:hypothetical protein